MKHPDFIFKFSDEDIAWAMAQLQRMEGLPGMPQTLEGLKSFAVAFLRIVGDQAAYEVEKYNVKESAWVKYPVEAVSRQETADWLIEKLLLSSERFHKILGRAMKCFLGNLLKSRKNLAALIC